MSKKLVLLFDGSLYSYRYYYALPMLKNSFGECTGSVYGTVQMVLNVIDRYNPNKVAVVFDGKGKKFRRKIFKEYKLNRKPCPKELKKQTPFLKDILIYLGISVLCCPHIEGDDVIGTLTKDFVKKGFSVLIVTEDKDMMQLVSKDVKLLSIAKNTILGSKEVVKKYGVFPNRISDFFSLLGDRIDGIPGVSGIGKKTASFLIKNIGDLFSIYKNLNKIFFLKINGKKRIVSNLCRDKKNAFLSYKLFSINKNVFLKNQKNHFELKNPNLNELFKLLDRCEFQRWKNLLHCGKKLSQEKFCKKLPDCFR